MQSEKTVPDSGRLFTCRMLVSCKADGRPVYGWMECPPEGISAMTLWVARACFGLMIGAAFVFTPPRLSAAAPVHRVPPGFVIEQVAAAPDVVFPMFAAFDDRGRLFVAESSGLDLYKEVQALTRKCRIRLLEDPDENGRFRKSSIWADN